jgi:hypothetical protein
MELQRGLPFGAICIEKSPLLACIQGRVAAEDGDHFATVWSVDETNNQTEWPPAGSRGFRALLLVQTTIYASTNLKSISLVYAPILNAWLNVMLTLVLLHAVTSCAQEATSSIETMEVEVLTLVYTVTWIELWFTSPWVAAAPGAANKVRKMKSSSQHGILTPAKLSNCLANPNAHAVDLSKALVGPNAHAVLTTNDMLNEIRVTTYRSSQQKDSGGGGGGGGTFEWYTGVVHVRVIVLNISGPYPHTFVGTSVLVAIIQMHFCPGVIGFGRFGFASSPVSLFMKFSMSDVPVPWLAEWIISSMRTDSSSAEQIFGVGSAWSVQRFGFLCTSMESVNSGGGQEDVASRTWGVKYPWG